MNRAVLNTPAPDTVPPPSDTLAFHRALPGYEATPLVRAPSLAAELGLDEVYIKDESSRFKYEDALEYARRAGVTIFAIGLDLPKGEARRQLAQISNETGGQSFFIDSVTELPAIYAALEKELRSQYLLAYQSTNTSKGTDFRNVEIKETYQDDQIKDMQAFQFTLTCEKGKS